ncbi:MULTISPECIES: MBL fold metallo-hydrolase [Thermomonospora]|uniref:Beta-lactamase domain protein n=1 Tax=Thermomonospora curvata (strain ATCC 19995 / DSM 43183 / JCM 3096 / KCTC 9072 / NBRC 15933 / NCIMB 10081 / Henssen B9) TaxID=471852 RepID=D1AD86_THECD|nr:MULTISPECIES: MBL fold metallo-hydrolase [Thermomonospora]ACY99395.1 beta-lactamase domain protein [Thermomonospora curvata DSM 43183]PKK12441.1 MAG: MBL fold metallo-hydrolase [Thermomonospora sp. CIF 1]
MRVTVIGCSGSFPGPKSPASSYLVEADGFSMLLDLGNGALGSLQRFHDVLDIDAICFTHLHPDHCLDLTVYWIARVYCPFGKAPVIPVYGPAGTAEHMAKAYELEPNPDMGEAFTFHEFPAEPFELGPFRVTAARVNHPVEAYGLRVEHEGKVLAYSGDTGGCQALIDIARGADLFLCEAAFVESRPNPPDMHLTGREAAEHAARAGVGRLVLTHLLPWNDPAVTLAEAKMADYSGPIELAQVGTVYEL